MARIGQKIIFVQIGQKLVDRLSTTANSMAPLVLPKSKPTGRYKLKNTRERERHLGSEATNRIGEGVIPGNYCALFLLFRVLYFCIYRRKTKKALFSEIAVFADNASLKPDGYGVARGPCLKMISFFH